MFCPQCGNKQGDELKFCKLCGANLYAVRRAVRSRDAGEKVDWNRLKAAEMLSEAEREQRLADYEHERGMTYELRRYNEIKGGVITSCIGLGLMLFLYVMGMAIYRTGHNPPDEAEIIRMVWAVGVIPFMVGVALIINGLFVSKQQVEAARRAALDAAAVIPDEAPDSLKPAQPHALRPADTSEIIPPDFSVTDGTTRHLKVRANKLQDTDNA